MPDTSAVLNLPSERTSALNGNHLQITKYESKKDNNYVRVSGNIAKMCSKVRQDLTVAAEPM